MGTGSYLFFYLQGILIFNINITVNRITNWNFYICFIFSIKRCVSINSEFSSSVCLDTIILLPYTTIGLDSRCTRKVFCFVFFFLKETSKTYELTVKQTNKILILFSIIRALNKMRLCSKGDY